MQMVLNKEHFGTFTHFLEKEGKSGVETKTQAISDLFNLRPKSVSQRQEQWAKQQCSSAA